MTKSYKLIKEEFDRAMSKLEERSPYPRGGRIGYGSEEQQQKFADERYYKSLDGMQELTNMGREMVKELRDGDLSSGNVGAQGTVLYFADEPFFKNIHNQIAFMRQGLGRYYKGTSFKKQDVSRELGSLIEKSRSLIARAIKMFPTVFKKYSSEYNREAGDGLPEVRLPDGEFYALVPVPVSAKQFQGYKGEKAAMNKKRFASQLRAHDAKLEAFEQLLINIQDVLEAIEQQRKRDENPQQQTEPGGEPQAAAEPGEEPQQQAKPAAKPAGGQSLADRLKGLEVR